MLSMIFANFKVVRYDSCCKLDLYFASEVIYGCKPYVPQYLWDYELPRAHLIPSKLLENN